MNTSGSARSIVPHDSEQWLVTVMVTSFVVAVAAIWIEIRGLNLSTPLLATSATCLTLLKRWAWNWWLAVPFVFIAAGHILNNLVHDTPYRPLSFGARLVVICVTAQIGFSIARLLADRVTPAWPATIIIIGGFSLASTLDGTNLPLEAVRLLRGGTINTYLNAVFKSATDAVDRVVDVTMHFSNVRDGPTATLLLLSGLVIWQGTRRQLQLILPLLAVAILFSLSRSAWLAAAIPIVLAAAWQARTWLTRRRFTFVGVTLAVVALVAAPIVGGVVIKRSGGSQDESAEVRTSAARDAITVIRRHLWDGAGYRFNANTAPHNLVLDAGLLGGVIAMIGAIMLAGLGVWTLLRGARSIVRTRDPTLDPRAALGATTLASLTSARVFVSGDPFTDLAMWGSLGLAIGILSISIRGDIPARRPWSYRPRSEP